jgi:hypothetical protein
MSIIGLIFAKLKTFGQNISSFIFRITVIQNLGSKSLDVMAKAIKKKKHLTGNDFELVLNALKDGQEIMAKKRNPINRTYVEFGLKR